MALILRVLLAAIGRVMSIASRIDPVLRSCITRDVVFEISTDDGVARHWRFDGVTRRVWSRPGHAPSPDCALRFADAGLALRSLVDGDPAALEELIAAGGLRVEGSAAVAGWFAGLVNRLTMIGRWRVVRQPLPHPYVRHDASGVAARFITVEPPQRELDRAWPAAWAQRAKLVVVRVPSGERPRRF
jgi:hypothetical protein